MRGRQWESKDLYEKYFKRQQKKHGKGLGPARNTKTNYDIAFFRAPPSCFLIALLTESKECSTFK